MLELFEEQQGGYCAWKGATNNEGAPEGRQGLTALLKTDFILVRSDAVGRFEHRWHIWLPS